jgi:hypothetical protein
MGRCGVNITWQTSNIVLRYGCGSRESAFRQPPSPFGLRGLFTQRRKSAYVIETPVLLRTSAAIITPQLAASTTNDRRVVWRNGPNE